MQEALITADEARTLFGLLSERATRSPDTVALSEYDETRRNWVDYSWNDILGRAKRIAAAFEMRGLTSGDRVAILLGNRVDWVCYDMAAHMLGLPVVACYLVDAPAASAHVLADAQPRILLIDTQARWSAIAATSEDLASIEEVWIHRGQDEPAPGVHGFGDVLAEAADAPGHVPEVDPGSIAALIYTSGTTGKPKGVMLTHRAILKNAEAVGQVVSPLPDDRFLSILPLAHAFERALGYVLPFMAGSSISYARSIQRLRQDLATVRPSVIMGVPRFYETIEASARRAAAGSPLKRALFEKTAQIGWKRFSAKAHGGAGLSLSETLAWPILQRLITGKVAQAFGGRLRVAVSGGAALEPAKARALIGLGVPLVEGYGLTEAGPVVTASTLKRYLPGHVGFALPGIDVKLSRDRELMIRSPSLMAGYWQNEIATQEILDASGWLSSGDLAEIRDGRIRIIGRAKNVLVLTNGENVNPEPIEAALDADPLFDQVCVIGDGKAWLAALIVLNRESWNAATAEAGISTTDPNTGPGGLLISERLKELLKEYPPHQTVRGFHADFGAWTVERGLLTPTLKPKRAPIMAEYQDRIDALYGQLRQD
ncbi:AMP-dependent synthetase/ligase [Halovulum sp. GXIMD14794]